MILTKTYGILAALTAALLTTTPFAAAALAEEETYSCSVVLGDGNADNNTCEFHCDKGSVITVSVSGTGGGGASISGSCGGASAGCSANDDVTCEDTSSETTASGTGSCQINPDNPGGDPDAGTGSCAASEVSTSTNECPGPYVAGQCVPPPGSAASLSPHDPATGGTVSGPAAPGPHDDEAGQAPRDPPVG